MWSFFPAPAAPAAIVSRGVCGRGREHSFGQVTRMVRDHGTIPRIGREGRLGGLPFLPAVIYLAAMSPSFRCAAANDNWPTASSRGGWLAVWWPVLAVLVLPPLVVTIGVVIAIML
jgi:hypothetical protein